VEALASIASEKHIQSAVPQLHPSQQRGRLAPGRISSGLPIVLRPHLNNRRPTAALSSRAQTIPKHGCICGSSSLLNSHRIKRMMTI
jgi:hypothetical protein